MSEEKKCKFEKAWIGDCNKVVPEGQEFCEEHEEIKCSSCGDKAVKECPETMGLVCGAPLCNNCIHVKGGYHKINNYEKGEA